MKNSSSLLGGLQFEYDEVANVFHESNGWNHEFNYSDGDEVEQRIYNIVSSVSDKSLFSAELASYINDWPTEYHFSPRRGNILRLIEGIRPGSRVLELGCGCGAITRYLAEAGCLVDAVEGSRVRAAIAAERVRELPNAKIFNSNFSNLVFENEYDFVTLIGVLEYAPKFIKADNPILSCLELAASALKSSGKLVVAIENQFGIKYFAGLPEDHHSEPYYGIEDKYLDRQVVTYGKRELTTHLENAGFKKIDFSYPYPDYKLPQVVVTDAGERSPVFNMSDLIYSSLLRHNERTPFFDISSTCQALERNGMLGNLSNSFLVVGSLNRENAEDSKGTFAEIYTDNRKPEYNTKTRVQAIGSEVVVLKEHLSGNNSIGSEFHSIGRTESYIKGEQLEVKICQCFKNSLQDQAYALLSMWVEHLKSKSSGSSLPGSYVDAVPKNFIIDKDGCFHLIDDEWLFGESVSELLVIFRGLRSIAKINDIKPYLEGGTEAGRVLAISRRLGLEKSFTKHWDEAIAFDKYLGEVVYGGGRWLVGYNPKKRSRPVLFAAKVRNVAGKVIRKVRPQS